jgi:hypothetical protein
MAFMSSGDGFVVIGTAPQGYSDLRETPAP